MKIQDSFLNPRKGLLVAMFICTTSIPVAQAAETSGTESATGESEALACNMATAKAKAPNPEGTRIGECVCEQTGSGVSGWECSVHWTAPDNGKSDSER